MILVFILKKSTLMNGFLNFIKKVLSLISYLKINHGYGEKHIYKIQIKIVSFCIMQRRIGLIRLGELIKPTI